ncbi:hypothetical protein BH09BAC1_BH09BAC1_29690 [soil metagenome]
MELLLSLLMWIGVLSPSQAPYINAAEAHELRVTYANQLEAEYPDEYAIIMIDENEVN